MVMVWTVWSWSISLIDSVDHDQIFFYSVDSVGDQTHTRDMP